MNFVTEINDKQTYKLCAKYCFFNTINKLKWRGRVAGMGKGEVCTAFWSGNLRGKDHLRDPGVDGRIIIKWTFRYSEVGVGAGSSWLRIGTGGGHL